MIENDVDFDATASANDLLELYCTYAIYNLVPQQELFYIGTIKLAEVMRFNDAYRNNYFRDHFDANKPIRLTVLHIHKREFECLQKQAECVRQYRPIANMTGHTVKGGHYVITCTQGPNAGKSYATITIAARQNGISQPTLSNHLNGVKGYTIVGGMKFKRGLP